MDHLIMGAAAGASGWLASPPGAYLLQWEQAQYDLEVADVFGYHALQIGLADLQCLRANRMHCRVLAGLPSQERAAAPAGQSCCETGRVVHIAQPEELPFATQSIDLIALPHVLESAVDPHAVLREVDRVLRPEGRLIVSGVNPASMWGARHVLPGGLPAGLLAPGARLIAAPRLRDWLRLLAFEPVRVRHGCYRPPGKTQKWLDRTAFLEPAGDRWWPICGAVYVQCAIKRVRAMRLVGAVWKRQRSARAPAVTAPLQHRVPLPERCAANSAGQPLSDTDIREKAAAD